MKKKNIHIVYIITKLELGGAQKVCLSLFKGLQQVGCSTHVISGNTGPLVSEVNDSADAILLSSMTSELSLKGMVHELYNFIGVIRILRRLKKKYSDLIVHTHSTKAGIVGRWAAWFAGVRIRIHTVHGYAFHSHQSRIAWCMIYLCELITSLITTHFVCVSAVDVKTGCRLFPYFSKKHSIIRAAVDVEQFYIPAYSLAPSSKRAFTFGTISCFKPQKNLFDMLHAFETVYLGAPHARLEIIGDGVLRPEIEKWIAAHNLEQVITLHGWLDRVVTIMETWHAFVMSSLWEGLPCAVVEARLLHLPVISYDTGGIHEVVIDQENGLLYKQGDWNGLARGMLRCMTEQDFYRRCQVYQDNLKDFNTAQMIDDHLLLYQRVLRQPGHNHKIMST